MKQAHYITDQENSSLITRTKFSLPNRDDQYTIIESSGYVEKTFQNKLFTRHGFIKRWIDIT